ncbi:MAG: glycosyltransferase family 39 protein [Candidatus Zixiibacteriota bacterium]|nr:MAG: glycosyltransferase family 39 protein [candidate division Zixibacteria bacterium]
MKQKKTRKASTVSKDKKAQFHLISERADHLLRKRSVSLAYLGILILLAFLVRLSHLEYFQAPLVGDAAIYGKIAWGIQNGHGLHWWSVVWPPFYPFMILLFSLVAGSLDSAAFAVSLLLGSLIVVPFFFLAKRIFDYRSAYLGSLLVVFFPALVTISATSLSEATYTFFLLLTLLLGWLLITARSLLFAFLFGLLGGICYLTRPEFLVAFALLVLIFLVAGIKRKTRRGPKTVGLLLICLLGFLILALPYVNFMHSQTGHWILSGKTAHNILKQKAYSKGLNYLEQRKAFAEVLDGLTPEGEVRGKVLLGEESMISYVTSSGFLAGYLKNAGKGLRGLNLFLLLFFLLSSFYLLSWKIDKAPWEKRVFLLCAFSPILTMPIFFSPAGRLVQPYAPLLILLSVAGILNIRKALARFSRGSGQSSGLNLGAFAVLLVVALLSVFSWTQATGVAEEHQATFRSLKLESEEFKKLGLWADQVLPPDAAVMYLSGDSFFFYCNRVTSPVPFASFDRIVEFSRKNGLDYMVVSLGKEASWRKDLSFLLQPLTDPGNVPQTEGLSLVDIYKAPSGLGAVLYKFEF